VENDNSALTRLKGLEGGTLLGNGGLSEAVIGSPNGGVENAEVLAKYDAAYKMIPGKSRGLEICVMHPYVE